MRDSDVEATLQWLPALGVTDPPAAGVKDMRGVGVAVAKFDSEDALQFFFPRRSLIMHRSMIRVLVRMLRRRGAHLVSITVTAEDYARHIEKTGKVDSPELRYKFASMPPEEYRRA